MPKLLNQNFNNDIDGIWSWFLSNIKNENFSELTDLSFKYELINKFLEENFNNSSYQSDNSGLRFFFVSIPDKVNDEMHVLIKLLRKYLNTNDLTHIEISKLTNSNNTYNHEKHYVLKNSLNNFRSDSFYINDGHMEKIPSINSITTNSSFDVSNVVESDHNNNTNENHHDENNAYKMYNAFNRQGGDSNEDYPDDLSRITNSLCELKIHYENDDDNDDTSSKKSNFSFTFKHKNPNENININDEISSSQSSSNQVIGSSMSEEFSYDSLHGMQRNTSPDDRDISFIDHPLTLTVTHNNDSDSSMTSKSSSDNIIIAQKSVSDGSPTSDRYNNTKIHQRNSSSSSYQSFSSSCSTSSSGWVSSSSSSSSSSVSTSDLSNISILSSASILDSSGHYQLQLQNILIYHSKDKKFHTAIKENSNNNKNSSEKDKWWLYDPSFSKKKRELLSLQDLLEFNNKFPKILFFSIVDINEENRKKFEKISPLSSQLNSGTITPQKLDTIPISLDFEGLTVEDVPEKLFDCLIPNFGKLDLDNINATTTILPFVENKSSRAETGSSDDFVFHSEGSVNPSESNSLDHVSNFATASGNLKETSNYYKKPRPKLKKRRSTSHIKTKRNISTKNELLKIKRFNTTTPAATNCKKTIINDKRNEKKSNKKTQKQEHTTLLSKTKAFASKGKHLSVNHKENAACNIM